jgi:hypothetical protein
VVAVRARRESRAVPPAPAFASLAQGLVGYWRFDEGAGTVARDRSASANDCQLRSGGGWTAGVLGGALALDGRAWLECAKVAPLARLDRALSISLWMKPAAWKAGRQAVLSRQLGDGAEDHFLLSLDGDVLEAQSDLWQSATKRSVNRPSGVWFHVAVVQKPDGRRTVYLDGAPIGRSNKSQPAVLGGGNNPLIIGGAMNSADRTAAGERFTGALDELALYDRALTAEEVQALAASQQPK